MTFEYRRTKGARAISIRVKSDKVIIRHPWYVPRSTAERFTLDQMQWILKQKAELLPDSEKDQLRNTVKKRVGELLPDVQNQVGVAPKLIRFKDMTSRWGSYSSKKTLNVSIYAARLSDEQLRYLLIHELCHDKHMNHSPQFWHEVEKYCPDYKKLKRALKKHRPGYKASQT